MSKMSNISSFNRQWVPGNHLRYCINSKRSKAVVKLYIPPTTSNIKEIKSSQKDIKHHTHEEPDKQLFLGKTKKT